MVQAVVQRFLQARAMNQVGRDARLVELCLQQDLLANARDHRVSGQSGISTIAAQNVSGAGAKNRARIARLYYSGVDAKRNSEWKIRRLRRLDGGRAWGDQDRD